MTSPETPPPGEPWSEGASIPDPRLASSVGTLWAESLRLGGEDVDAAPPVSFAAAQQMLAEASMALVALLETPGGDDTLSRHVRAGHLLAGVGAATADLRDAAFAQGLARFAQVRQAIGRLRAIDGVDAMLVAACAEICRCGFDRAMVTRADEGIATIVAAHNVADDEAARAFMARAGGGPTRIEHSGPEAEMIRRRAPLLVGDTSEPADLDATLLEATGARSYVAAPVFSRGQLVALVHADCRVSRRTVDAFDRDLLAIFAQELGNAYERAVLLERLAALRQEVRRANRAVLAVVDEYVEADLEVARIDREDGVLAQSAAAVFVTADVRLERLLTPREREVAELMADGETNGDIAARLVVSEATVKSHVKHILRKLRASNRAEAVSMVIRMSRPSG